MPVLLIAGSRGIPASYGGFETFCQEIGPYLTDQFDQVVVTGFTSNLPDDLPKIERLSENIFSVRVKSRGWVRLQNLIYTYRAAKIAINEFSVTHVLVLNDVNFLTALSLQRLGVRTAIHLDGNESARKGLPILGRFLHLIFRALSVRFIDAIVVDSLVLKKMIKPRFQQKLSVIKYGANRELASIDEIKKHFDLPEKYLLVVARMVPENNILEIVSSHLESKGDSTLLIFGLGTGKPSYEKKVIALADKSNHRVMLKKAFYQENIINRLLRNAVAYIHGHEAGGTNPILISARQHAQLILAHDNHFNREGITKKELLWKSGKVLTDLLNEISKPSMNSEPMLNVEDQPLWHEIAKEISNLIQNLGSSKAAHE